jgi:azurin
MNNNSCTTTNRNLATLHWLPASALLLLGAVDARAADCQFTIEGNDQMQYSQRQLHVPASCGAVDLTLKHSGQQPINVIGHNWVLAKSSDVNVVVAAGLNAGRDHNYQAANDARIIAATPLVGGGQSTTIHFSTEHMQPGGDYTFFCTYPGHAVLMKGSLVFGERTATRVAAASTRPAPER